ncbi:MAG: sugar phosphate isomerase/epimerase [Herpetosiphonaceae bacterium]|nr:sugar phosphate isomerase/epimerase [Herpetosiphonaceae bacterium]
MPPYPASDDGSHTPSDPHTKRRAGFGVAAYTFPYSCGFAQRPEQPRITRPLDAWGLIDLAAAHHLSSVELPLLSTLPDLSASTIKRLRMELAERDLSLVVDIGVVDQATQGLLPVAADAGGRVVRVMLSTILEGARGDFATWTAYLDEMRQRIIELVPILEEHDLVLALENHQDASSDELLALCEAGGPRIGVTFDVVNPLAVGEEPFAFARKLGSFIRNVHLKDYQIFATPSGYRLVRCALGQGVIDWRAMRALLHEVAPGAFLHIELAALYGRHIRLLEEEWWRGYPPRDVREVVPTLRLLAGHVQPEGHPWQTPWERQAPGEEVAAYEMEQFEASVRHLQALETMEVTRQLT